MLKRGYHGTYHHQRLHAPQSRRVRAKHLTYRMLTKGDA